MQVLIPEWAQAMDGVGALSSLRVGGVSGPPYDDGNGGGGLNLGAHVGDRPQHVRQNRRLLRALLPAEPAWLEQVHGTRVIDAAAAASEAHGAHEAPLPQADAGVANRPGVVCAVLTADCLPVLFADPAARVVGAAHAGWRGLAGGVLENTVAHMRTAGAADIGAWLGPAIGPDSFEVGEDVLRAFVALDARHRAAFRPIAGRDGKYLADIYALARAKLAVAGVRHISGGGFCTVAEKQRFYSYRRDGVTGRMASLIWLK